MNYKPVFAALALLVGLLALFMVPSIGWSLFYHDGQWLNWIVSLGIVAGAGGALWLGGRGGDGEILQREALIVVGLGWIVAGAAGAVPFLVTGVFHDFHDAFFETVSGFTTTGATVLTEIESQSPSLLFWRSMTHWLGGIGIIVIFIAVMPFFNAARRLYRTEIPGVSTEGLTPRIKETAMVLVKIYLGLTVAETLLLMGGGMTLFDALCHSFGTLATGGFSTKNNSILFFDSAYIEGVIIVFMLLAGSNFTLHYFFTRGKWGVYFRDPECRAYLITLAAGTALAAAMVCMSDPGMKLTRAIRDGAFTVTSIMTTTGFCTANFSAELHENIGGWPNAGKALLVMLMFIGGCGGSTGGGIKVIRFLALFRIFGALVERAYSPRAVRQVTIGGRALDSQTQFMVLAFFFAMMIITGVSTLTLALLEPHLDLVSLFTAVAATLNNIGPGLYEVGAVENYAHFSAPSKYILSLCMIIGRLELIPIAVLFAPRFWRVH